MNIFLAKIAANTQCADIREFITPALKTGFFQKPGRILNIDILALRDLRNGNVERHGLAAIEALNLNQSIQRLDNKPLNGKHVHVRPYYLRSWYNDPRQHDIPLTHGYVEKRRGDRRRGHYLERLQETSDTPYFNKSVAGNSPHPCVINLQIPKALEPQVAQILQLEGLSLLSQSQLADMQTAGLSDPAAETSKLLQIGGEKTAIYRFLDKIRRHQPQSGIRYWIASIVESGNL